MFVRITIVNFYTTRPEDLRLVACNTARPDKAKVELETDASFSTSQRPSDMQEDVLSFDGAHDAQTRF